MNKGGVIPNGAETQKEKKKRKVQTTEEKKTSKNSKTEILPDYNFKC